MKTEFTEKEISFIKECQYSFNFDNPSDEDWEALQGWALATLVSYGFTDSSQNYANEIGDTCEDIIDIANAHLDAE